jgi:hypothetical protein
MLKTALKSTANKRQKQLHIVRMQHGQPAAQAYKYQCSRYSARGRPENYGLSISEPAINIVYKQERPPTRLGKKTASPDVTSHHK